MKFLNFIILQAIIERVVVDYKDVLKDAIENSLQSAAEMPYFEGDFWPNVLEESIRELDIVSIDKLKYKYCLYLHIKIFSKNNE